MLECIRNIRILSIFVASPGAPVSRRQTIHKLSGRPEVGAPNLGLFIFVTALLLIPAWGQTETAILDQLQRPIEAVATENHRQKPDSAAELSQPLIPTSNGKEGVSKHQLQKLSGFWIIAIVINLTVVLAYLVWAIGQWRKQSARNQ